MMKLPGNINETSVFTGACTDIRDREAKQKIYDLLDSKGIEYSVIEHKAVYTIEEMNLLNLPHQDAIAKNLFLCDEKKKKFFLLSIQEDKKADLKKLRETIGTRLRFSPEYELERILGLEKGAVTPFGALNDKDHCVKIYLDEDFIGRTIAVHPNRNTATVWLQTEKLAEILSEFGALVEYIAV